MKFARVVFTIAGVYGVLILTPMYFVFDVVGRQTPPPVTHPEFYYGFVGLGLVWQIAFLVIASDPARFRPMMIPSVLEKATWFITVVVLYLQHRTGLRMLFSALGQPRLSGSSASRRTITCEEFTRFVGLPNASAGRQDTESKREN